MNYKNLVTASALLLVSVSANAFDFGVGVKGGTTGTGVDLSMTLTDTINLRLSSTSYDFGSSSESFDIDSDDGQSIATINSDLSIDFGATSVLFDWYVFDGTFHMTAGMVKNNSSLNINGDLVGTDVTFGGISYNISNDFDSSAISGTVSLGDSFEPYFGFGWGRKASSDSGLSLSVEIGVMLLTPTVDLTSPTLSAAGLTKASQSELDVAINDAEAEVKAELSNLEMWPVISVGFNYAF